MNELQSDKFRQSLTQRKKNGLFRSRFIVDGPQQPYLSVDGKEYLAFCSNDYLGLANHPDVKQAFKKAVDEFGVGSGASHLVSGHHRAHHQLEEELAEFTGYSKALVFSSGYMANLGIVSALFNDRSSNNLLIEDKLNHASLIDAGLHSNAKFHRYLHSDIDSLGSKLKKGKLSKNKLVLTDAVFSMDGDIAPIAEIARCCCDENALLMVDDAHGFGVLGNSGAGSLEHLSVDVNNVPIYMATFGKSLGTAGAFVAGDDDLIEMLIQYARTYIYTTALPPAVAAATLESLKIVQADSERRIHLQALIEHFKRGAQERQISLLDSVTAIQPIVIGEAHEASRIASELKEKGVLVPAIRPPTVPENTARLRVTLSAAHSFLHVNRLLDTLQEILQPESTQ